MVFGRGYGAAFAAQTGSSHDGVVKHLVAVAIFALIAAATAVSAGISARYAAADEGWTIDRFAANIDVQTDGSLLITEAIDVDFGSLEKHGIFREIPIEYDSDAKSNRIYGF